MKLSDEDQKKQEFYRDARTGGYYDGIWKTVGKCVFCDLKSKYIVHEENGMVLVVALFAYIDGDMMVIPRRHVKTAKELTPSEWETTRKLMYIAKKVLRKVYGLQDIQYVLRDGGILVGSTVQDHFHMHCIPSDGPDLTVWNYRKLKYTPLENAELMRAQRKTINRLAERFDEKYAAAPQTATAGKREIYREAFKQALANKKKSLAKKTARVGAAVFTGGKIISMCNANLAEGPTEVEKDGLWVSTPTVSHAEERCIARAARDGVSLHGATMIVTLSPCMACSRQIVNSGIKELHYVDDWWDKNALSFLADNNVKVVRIPYRRN